MDEFPSLFQRDYGIRPQGKAAPMSAAKMGAAGIGSGEPFRSSTKGKSAWSSTPAGGSSLLDGHEGMFSAQNNARDYVGFGDVYGGPPRYTGASDNRNTTTSSSPPFAYDSIFQGSKDIKDGPKSSTLPVYDKPVYDDDIFDGVPGLKSSSSVKYADVFTSMSSPSMNSSSAYNDLLDDLGRGDLGQKGSTGKTAPGPEVSGFDDLIPGFGGSQNRDASERNKTHQSSAPSSNLTPPVRDDPFVVLESTTTPVHPSEGLFPDPLEKITKSSNSSSSKANKSSLGGGILDDINVFDGLTNNKKEKSPSRGRQNSVSSPTMNEPAEKPSTKNTYRDSYLSLFEMPASSSNSYKPANGNGSRAIPDVNANISESSPQVGMSPRSDGSLETTDDAWLTVSEIPLFTQPTAAPPPARPPPRPPVSKADFNTQKWNPDVVKSAPVSSIDELEELAMGRPPRVQTDDRSDVLSGDEDIETNSAAAASAAAMKEAMDRAEAKFKHAKEVREREKDARPPRGRETTRLDADDSAVQDALDRENREKQERLEREREQKEHEEKEREQRRLEKEREQWGRQAVDKATREVRDRITDEVRRKVERAAVQRAQEEARKRAAEEARKRAAEEARKRAAEEEARKRAAEEEARKRAAEEEARKRAVAEAKEKAKKEAREKADREAKEKLASDWARERDAVAAREKQQKNENDLESIFNMNARPNSAPKQRATSSDPFDTQFPHGSSNDVRRTPVGTSPNMRKVSSTTNIGEDLSSLFGPSLSSEEFQEKEGESEERRRARLERQQKTLERAKKALAEKNERDFQLQREQTERHRIAETLDVEIKRWALGKEGNLRALLSSLQYVLWPECGWQPVSLTDLIAAAQVKKVYRKATLCIHPDKVQQKGANIQQKYVAEKVFDLLKEAWTKFNSEELF